MSLWRRVGAWRSGWRSRRAELMEQIRVYPYKARLFGVLAGGVGGAVGLFVVVTAFTGGLGPHHPAPPVPAPEAPVPSQEENEPGPGGSMFEGVAPGGIEDTYSKSASAPAGVEYPTDLLFWPLKERRNPDDFVTWVIRSLATSPTQHKLPVNTLTSEWEKYMTDSSTTYIANWDPKFRNNFFQQLYLGEKEKTSVNITELKPLLDREEVIQWWGKEKWRHHFKEFPAFGRIYRVTYQVLQTDKELEDLGVQDPLQTVIDENQLYVYISTRNTDNGEFFWRLETATQTPAGKAMTAKYTPKHNR